jgi:hypothetical protein
MVLLIKLANVVSEELEVFGIAIGDGREGFHLGQHLLGGGMLKARVGAPGVRGGPPGRHAGIVRAVFLLGAHVLAALVALHGTQFDEGAALVGCQKVIHHDHPRMVIVTVGAVASSSSATRSQQHGGIVGVSFQDPFKEAIQITGLVPGTFREGIGHRTAIFKRQLSVRFDFFYKYNGARPPKQNRSKKKKKRKKKKRALAEIGQEEIKEENTRKKMLVVGTFFGFWVVARRGGGLAWSSSERRKQSSSNKKPRGHIHVQ